MCGAKCVWHGQVGTGGHYVAHGGTLVRCQGTCSTKSMGSWILSFGTLSYVQIDVLEAYCAGKNVFGTANLPRVAIVWHTVGGRGAKAHVKASAWEVGFYPLERYHMSKLMFWRLIVRGKMCSARPTCHGWPLWGTLVGCQGTCSSKCMGSWILSFGTLLYVQIDVLEAYCAGQNVFGTA